MGIRAHAGADGQPCRVLAGAPGEALLVWTGNSHAATKAADDWMPLACWPADAVIVSTDNALS